MRSLWFGENVKEAVDAPRIHHQLYPMEVMYEYGVLQVRQLRGNRYTNSYHLSFAANY